jgi:hypothetical protein
MCTLKSQIKNLNREGITEVEKRNETRRLQDFLICNLNLITSKLNFQTNSDLEFISVTRQDEILKEILEEKISFKDLILREKEVAFQKFLESKNFKVLDFKTEFETLRSINTEDENYLVQLNKLKEYIADYIQYNVITKSNIENNKSFSITKKQVVGYCGDVLLGIMSFETLIKKLQRRFK